MDYPTTPAPGARCVVPWCRDKHRDPSRIVHTLGLGTFGGPLTVTLTLRQAEENGVLAAPVVRLYLSQPDVPAYFVDLSMSAAAAVGRMTTELHFRDVDDAGRALLSAFMITGGAR